MVPLSFEIDGKSYKDGIDITNEEFFRLLDNSKIFPKTSQPSPQSFKEVFEDAKKNNDTVLAILLSSGLSGTVQSAFAASAMVNYENIYIFDTLSALGGERLYIEYAMNLRDKEHLEIEQIIEKLETLKPKMQIVSQIDTLDYLHKGGRLSKVEAFIGNVLNLKPMIRLNQKGQIEVYEKSIGKARGYKSMLRSISHHPIDYDFPVYMPYCKDDTNCKEMIEKLKSIYPNLKNIVVSQIGPVTGSHVGPNGFGIIYVEKK